MEFAATSSGKTMQEEMVVEEEEEEKKNLNLNENQSLDINLMQFFGPLVTTTPGLETKTEIQDIRKKEEPAPAPAPAPAFAPAVIFYIGNPPPKRTKVSSLELQPPKLKAPSTHALKPFPFLYKLFLVARSEHVGYVNWSEDGQQVELHYLELQYHLASTENIFHCGTVLQFTQLLTGHGFERVTEREDPIPESPFGIVLIYQHEHFVRDKPEKLQWITEKISIELENENASIFERPLGHPSAGHLKRMSKRGDLCSSFIMTRSNLQLARGRLSATVRYHNDSQLLKERGSSLEVLAELLPRRGRASVGSRWGKHYGQFITNLAGIRYVKPHESVSEMPATQITDYAGYFGNVSVNLVKEFFAEYLPRYGQSKTDIVMDATTKTNNFHQNLPIGINYSDDDDDDDDDSDMPQAKSNSKKSNQAQTGQQESKVEAIDGSIEKLMDEICGEAGNLPASPGAESSSRAKATTTTTSKPKVRKKRKLIEECSTTEEEEEEEEEEDDEEEEQILKEPMEDTKIDNELNPEEDKKKKKKKKEEKDDDNEKKDKKENNHSDILAPKGETQKASAANNDSEDEEEEDEDFDDDDDYVDKNVEYRTSTKKKPSDTPRRYDLRNTKRPTKRYL